MYCRGCRVLSRYAPILCRPPACIADGGSQCKLWKGSLTAATLQVANPSVVFMDEPTSGEGFLALRPA